MKKFYTFLILYMLLVVGLPVPVFAQEAALPDNIISNNVDKCVVPFEKIDFKVKQKWSMANQGHHNTGVLVGDLDGDGIAEIVVYNPELNQIRILNDNGNAGVQKASINLSGSVIGSGGWHPTMTAVLVNSDPTKNKMGEIIITHPNRTIESWEADMSGGTFSMKKKWPLVGTVTFDNPTADDNLPQPIVADFNGDGNPELVVYNKIYNAATGDYIGQTEPIASAFVGRVPGRPGNKATNFMTTADFDGDGLPEIVAGGKIYKVKYKTDGTFDKCEIIYENTSISDGFTAVADIDMDGNLDVVVTNVPDGGTSTYLHVWSPKTGTGTAAEKRKGVILSRTYVYNDAYSAQSYPFVGDIDGLKDPNTGKRHPEICLVVPFKVKGFKFDTSPTATVSDRLINKWTLTTTDLSGGTGITLFDFNGDNKQELVYRDQDSLKILSLNIEKDIFELAGDNDPNSSFHCASGTAFEYPVIADIDGDGSANICVTCIESGISNVRVYESGNQPWSPTRSVWNQVNYEPTQINSDLTVPTRAIPKNRKFGVNGEDYFPFNGTLMQIPIMDIGLTPVVEAADPFVKSIKVESVAGGQKVSVVVGNKGLKNSNSSLPISLYGESLSSAARIESKTVGVTISPNQEATVIFTVPTAKVSSAYFARLQDDGGAVYPVAGFLDCTPNNNTFSSGGVFTNDDSFLVFNKKIENQLDILKNDIIADECSGATISITTQPEHGTLTVIGQTVIYKTNNDDYVGSDKFEYKLECGTYSSQSEVQLNVVPKPDNVSDADCFIESTPAKWDIQVDWIEPGAAWYFNTPLVGDLDNDTNPEIVCLGGEGVITSNPPLSRIILVYDGVTRLQKRKITLPAFVLGVGGASYGLVKLPTKQGLIVVACDDNYIYAYDITKPVGEEQVWKSDNQFGTLDFDASTNMGFADFNNDGHPEVYVRNKIFDAATGKLLLTVGDGNTGFSYSIHYQTTATVPKWGLSSPVAADMFGDAKLELILGNEIYEVNIKSRTNPMLNSSILAKSITPPMVPGGNLLTPAYTQVVSDGHAQVADFDNDGHLDVLITSRNTGSVIGYVAAYVWNVRKNTVSTPLIISTRGPGKSIPVIADVNNNKALDIVIQCETHQDAQYQNGAVVPGSKDYKIRAYEYNSNKNAFDYLWGIPANGLFTNGATVFDFNLDGINEVLVSGRDYMTIYNGSGKSHITGKDTLAIYKMNELESNSLSVMQYPVIADADNDGHAEIVALGNLSLKIFRSKGEPWAPARSVWNQYMYNSVNVNDDLTIPAYQLNPGTVFPGKDGVMNTTDDVRPFNASLKQQTPINRNGIPLFITPRAEIVDGDQIKYSYNRITNELTISDFKITNTGEVLLKSPIPISVYYKKKGESTYHKFPQAITHNTGIPATTPATVHTVTPFKVGTIDDKLPIDNIFIRLNDNGNGTDYHYVCECEVDSCNNNNSEILIDLTNLDFDSWTRADNYRLCQGSSVAFTAETLPAVSGIPVEYHWYTPSNSTTPFSSSQTTTKTNLQLTDGGQYTFKADNIRGYLSLIQSLPYLSVASEKMQWKSTATNSNWNDIDNWEDLTGTAPFMWKAVPSECTEVTLPDNANVYPSLENTITQYDIYGDPTVKTINFHFGSLLGHQHKLIYNKAQVYYNWRYYNPSPTSGSTPDKNDYVKFLERDRWYTLAAPLKNMVSGDFGYLGRPYVWQSHYNITHPSGTGTLTEAVFGSTYANNAVRLSTTNNSIAVKVAPYNASQTGYTQQNNLNSLNGTLIYPYYENANAKSHGHEYDPFSRTSTLYYFDVNTLQQLNKADTVKRGEESYRFVYEDVNKNTPKITVDLETVHGYLQNVSVPVGSTTKKVLIGNPFMTPINTKNFFDANSTEINSTFEFYDPASKNWIAEVANATLDIAPLQAFVVTLKNNSAELKYPLEGSKAIKAPTKVAVRSAEESTLLGLSALKMRTTNLINGLGGDYALLTTGTPTLSALEKMIHPEGHATPEVFIITPEKSSYMQITPYQSSYTQVPLGIKTSNTTDLLSLEFLDVDNFIAQTGQHPVLVDNYLGLEQSLLDNPRYDYYQRAVTNTQHTDQDRFIVRFHKNGDQSKVETTDIQISYTHPQLEITGKDALLSVTICDLNGRVMKHYDLVTPSTLYRDQLHLPSGVYIVKVVNANRLSKSRKIVVK